MKLITFENVPSSVPVNGEFVSDKLIYLVKYGKRDTFYRVTTLKCVKYEKEGLGNFFVRGFRIKIGDMGNPMHGLKKTKMICDMGMIEAGFGHLFLFNHLGNGETTAVSSERVFDEAWWG